VRKGDNENEDRTGCVQTEAVIACRGRALRMTKANRGPRVLIRRPVWRWLRKSVSVPNYGRVEFLTSALDEGEGSISCPGRFTPGERAFGTHRIGGWVGPRADLDAMGKRGNFMLLPGIETQSSSP